MNLFRRLTRLRIVSLASNLKNYSVLKKNAGLYRRLGIRKKFWQSLSYTDIPNHDGERPWLDTKIPAERIRSHPEFGRFEPTVQEGILQWPGKGYMILPDFFPVEWIDQARESILPSLSESQKKTYFSNRLVNLHRKNHLLSSLINDERLLRLLSFLLGRPVQNFQSINFYKSSSQPAHSDSLHLTTEPLGYLICVWIALEDIAPGCGEYFYYPGSHSLPFLHNKTFKQTNSFWKLDHTLHAKYEEKVAEVIEREQLVRQTFTPKKGTILVWHGNLLHGSMPRLNATASRQSLIGHYFAEGALYYHESMEKPVVMHPKS